MSTTMDVREARAILALNIQSDGSLSAGGEYFAWSVGETTACLNGHFSASELEAIALWMRLYSLSVDAEGT